jgi:predicted component of type VI protein secretion system
MKASLLHILTFKKAENQTPELEFLRLDIERLFKHRIKEMSLSEYIKNTNDLPYGFPDVSACNDIEDIKIVVKKAIQHHEPRISIQSINGTQKEDSISLDIKAKIIPQDDYDVNLLLRMKQQNICVELPPNHLNKSFN